MLPHNQQGGIGVDVPCPSCWPLIGAMKGVRNIMRVLTVTLFPGRGLPDQEV